MPEATNTRRAVLHVLAIAAALYLMTLFALSQPQQLDEGRNDFLPFYAGSHLLSSGELYDNAQLLKTEAQLTGFVSETHGYIRPPFLAALVWPLSRLPYRTAWRVWQAASLAALIGFVLLWAPDRRLFTLLLTAISIPALLAWLAGQDVFFLLLAIALSVHLHRAGKPIAAGAVFALCAAKVHLFLLTPVWVIALGDWSFLKGQLYGGGALAGLSTAAAGWRWPLEMWRETRNSAFSPSLGNMPNLHGMLESLPLAWAWEMLLSAAVAWAVWTIARRASFQTALAAGLLGGILLARHSYVLDLTLLIPAMLVLLQTTRRAALRICAAALLAPPLLFLAIQGLPYSAAVVLICWVALIGWALEFRGEPRFAGTPA